LLLCFFSNRLLLKCLTILADEVEKWHGINATSKPITERRKSLPTSFAEQQSSTAIKRLLAWRRSFG
jgi:hypothetical protein